MELINLLGRFDLPFLGIFFDDFPDTCKTEQHQARSISQFCPAQEIESAGKISAQKCTGNLASKEVQGGQFQLAAAESKI